MRQKREVRANLPGAVVPPQNPQHHQTTFGGIMPVMVWLWYRYGGGTAVLDVTFRANPSLSVTWRWPRHQIEPHNNAMYPLRRPKILITGTNSAQI